MLTLLAFVAALALLIVVHEWGHYRMARACGVKVLRFSVGFGKTLWRYQRTPESTEFVLAALPLGGYVRMLDEREGAVPQQDLDQAFNRKPVGQRALIVTAGPLANLVLAVFLYACAATLGLNEPRAVISSPTNGSMAERAGLRSGDWIREFSVSRSRASDSLSDSDWEPLRSYTELRWVLMRAALDGQRVGFRVTSTDGASTQTPRQIGHIDFAGFDPKRVDANLFPTLGLTGLYTEPVMGAVQSSGAAAAAGLREGDRVQSINGRAVRDGRDVIERVRSAPTDSKAEQVWVVRRGTETLELAVKPRVERRRDVDVGRIEAYVGAPPPLDTIQLGWAEAAVYGLRQTWEVSLLTLQMLGKMLIGEASLSNLSGPVTIAQAAGQSAEAGVTPYLIFLALVSVSLGVLNLLPLPMLDGGHLMYYLWEVIRGKPVPDAWLEGLQKVGLVVILLMMSLALFNDVSRLSGL